MLLLICGIVLVLGLVGEYGEWNRKKLWELLVIVGVAGELLGDGGIFVFSEQLQSISNGRIGELNIATAQVNLELSKQRERTANAEAVADNLRERAARAEKDLLALRLRVADRTLSALQRDAIISALKNASPATITISCVGGSSSNEPCSFADQLKDVILQAKWTVLGGGRGMSIAGVTVPPLSIGRSDGIIPTEGRILIAAFQKAGLTIVPNGGVHLGSTLDLLVGPKP